MDGKVCLYVSLAAGLALLAGGCGRRSAPAAAKARPDHAHAFNSPGDNAAANKMSTAPGLADSSIAELKSSPFTDLPPSEPHQALPPLPDLNSSAHRAAAKPARVLKPFTPPAEIASVRKPQVQAALPAPPAIGAPLNSGESPIFAGIPGTTATATYEPASPRGIRRIFHRFAGNRKGAAVTGGKDFIPPKPTREIQFVLPPGPSAALAKAKEVNVKAEVDATGRVTRVELLSPRDEELATLAGYAASHWSFTPAKLDDQAVPGEVILHFDFTGSPAPAKAAR